jgi:perosamine synthetase
MRSLANHGRDSIYINIDDDKKATKEIIARRFNFVRHGHSFRCTEMEAALGVSQIKRMNSIISSRKRIAKMYRKGLADLSKYLGFQEATDGAENVYMLFGIVLKKGDRDELINYLELNGIETRSLLPLVGQPIYKDFFKDSKRDYPVADMLASKAFYIGVHQYLSDSDVAYVIKVFHNYFRKTK